MVMGHDAATTYLTGGLLHQINDWTKTQADGGPSGMLNCGARGFDWRPKLKSDGSVVMHHGDIEVSHPMQDALTDMIKWCTSHPTVEDLVVLSIVDCAGDPVKGVSCVQAAKKLLSAHGITYIDNCSELNGLTVEGAAKRAN